MFRVAEGIRPLQPSYKQASNEKFIRNISPPASRHGKIEGASHTQLISPKKKFFIRKPLLKCQTLTLAAQHNLPWYSLQRGDSPRDLKTSCWIKWTV